MYRKRGHFESGNVLISSHNLEHQDAIRHPQPNTMRSKELGM